MTSTPFALATLLFAASLTAAAAQNSAAPPHHHHKHHATAAQAKPAAAAQNAAAHSHHHRKHHTTAAQAKPAAALPTSSVSKQALAPLLAPPAAPSPALAPATSLVVAYKDGALAITSQSATLSEIFGRIHECTGAVIEAPALDESVSVQLGPEPPADVIAALLEGLPLNYAILGGASDQQRIERIIVTSIPPPGSQPAAPPRNFALEEEIARARARAQFHFAEETGGDEGVWENQPQSSPAPREAPSPSPPTPAHQ